MIGDLKFLRKAKFAAAMGKMSRGATEDQVCRAVHRRAGRSAVADPGDRSERMSARATPIQ